MVQSHTIRTPLQSVERRPLDGVVVLDMSRVLAGPWASQILADLGATVIKVERPRTGDDTRQWGPPFTALEDGTPSDAAYFLCANRNKQSVEIDFRTPQGADLIRQLAQKSHILLENYKVDGLKKYQLDYESMRQLHPKLVYCSVTGFGQTGEYRHQPGYDFAIQAMGGLMSITGESEEKPGGGPLKTGVAIADLFAGMYASVGMLAALRHAEHTGIGQHLDVSLFDCQIAMLANQAMNYLTTNDVPRLMGNAHPNIVPYTVYSTKDRPIVIAVGNDRQFRDLCKLLKREELAEDDRFITNAARVQNRACIDELIQSHLVDHPASFWLEALTTAHIPSALVNTLNDVFNDPHARDRKLTFTPDNPLRTNVRYVRHPVQYSDTPVPAGAEPPHLGAHTGHILRDLLGMTNTQIEELAKTEIIGHGHGHGA